MRKKPEKKSGLQRDLSQSFEVSFEVVMRDDQDGAWRVKHVESLTVQNLRV